VSRSAVLRLSYAIATLAVLAADQATKDVITSRMSLYSSVPVIPGFLHLTLVTNRGALFGLFHDLAEPYRSVLFTSIPMVAIGLILFFQYRTTLADRAAQAGLALILGGALGNLVDRLRLGYVVDFIDMFLGEHHWPAFNLADSSICIGVTLLVIDLVLQGRRQHVAEMPPVA
jgi:signal peptidase II